MVAQGDTWDAVAFRLYGNESRMDALIRANPEYRRVVIFTEPTVIRVPDLPDTIEEHVTVPWMD